MNGRKLCIHSPSRIIAIKQKNLIIDTIRKDLKNIWLSKRILPGNSLAVQWLGLPYSTAEGAGLIPDWGTKIPQARRCGQKKKNCQIQKNTCHMIPFIWSSQTGKTQSGDKNQNSGCLWDCVCFLTVLKAYQHPNVERNENIPFCYWFVV